MGLLSLLKPEHRFFYGHYSLLQNTDLNRNVQTNFKQNVNLVTCHVFHHPELLRAFFLGDDYLTRSLELKNVNLYRASDISRSHGPAKFRYFRKIPQNSQKNAKYYEICQKYFQIHVGKTYLILILAIRPVLFTLNVQIYLETSSLQQVNNIPKLPDVFR